MEWKINKFNGDYNRFSEETGQWIVGTPEMGDTIEVTKDISYVYSVPAVPKLNASLNVEKLKKYFDEADIMAGDGHNRNFVAYTGEQGMRQFDGVMREAYQGWVAPTELQVARIVASTDTDTTSIPTGSVSDYIISRAAERIHSESRTSRERRQRNNTGEGIMAQLERAYQESLNNEG